MAQERLQKILARAGIASRRAAEDMIEQGRVKVDGKVVTELGVKADPDRQKIMVDNKLIGAEPLVYVVFHKPREVMCTMSDPEGRETVAEYVKQVAARVVPVGRLDYHTSGVLLLTNDGDFAAKLLHPSNHVEKVYVSKVRGVLKEEDLEPWRAPIDIDGRTTQPADVRRMRVEGDKTWIQVTLREGRNRHIHRLAEAAGSAVFRLARVSFAGVNSDGLRPGQWRYLGREELTFLKNTFGVPKRVMPAPPLPNADELRQSRASGIGRGERGVVDGKPRRRWGETERLPRERSYRDMARDARELLEERTNVRGEAPPPPRRGRFGAIETETNRVSPRGNAGDASGERPMRRGAASRDTTTRGAGTRGAGREQGEGAGAGFRGKTTTRGAGTRGAGTRGAGRDQGEGAGAGFRGKTTTRGAATRDSATRGTARAQDAGGAVRGKRVSPAGTARPKRAKKA